MKKILVVSITFSFLLLAGVYANTLFTKNDTPNVATMLKTIDTFAFKASIEEEERTIIDVRTPGEYAQGHIAGSVNIDFNDPSFVDALKKLDTEKSYAIYCRSGNRSGQALELMDSLGFVDVLDLQGGVVSWERNGNTLCTNC